MTEALMTEALMWLGVWLFIANVAALPLFLYLRRMPKKKFVYMMYVLHHWLQNFDKGYTHEDAMRDLAKMGDL